ncbi:10236_t:CDS:10 [Diversispora eburnea]|uniref:GPI ethanolamine phosphate transferase 2 n=1 Tax=Diversispora eburnea TaxID=1213867 RepID=A0A9N8V7A0_9GLOM|nr:10236_t:CDS:10 [Diversispora eburnea]
MFYIRKTWAILIILLGAQFIGLGLFSKGFFPYKKILSGFAKIEDLPRYPNGKEALPPEPLFDKLVFMLNSGMEFVKSLIESHRAIPYTAHASAPTVTLPRIKALTTGTVPNFLDAIFNIAESDTSSLEFQDNWLTQLKNARNKTISFFGDDTWINLFPGIFKVTDGTSSLFATDTVEVDLNVTRNVVPQLLSPEWDALIFHYLGLDHIGHSSGPYSPLMIPKQREMDNVVKTIFEIIVKQDEIRIEKNENAKPTLFVLCGDHGMNEAGNHGGSSIGETSTAFVFMSSKFNYMNYRNNMDYKDHTDNYRSLKFYKVVNQIDFVPTLSFAFGIPIPRNNLGKVMLDVFVDIDPLERLRALQLNAHQLSGILLTLWNSFARDPEKIEEIEKIEKLCNNSDKDEETRLQCLYLFAYYFHSKALEFLDEESIENASLFYEEFITEASSLLSSSSSDYNIESMCWGLLFMGFASISFIMILTIGFCVTLFTSSFIEEEHQFWYFWMQTTWFGLLFNRLTLISLGQMILVRLIRSWNQTGGFQLFQSTTTN